MSAQADNLFLLVCGKATQDRTQFLQSLYNSVERRWRVRHTAIAEKTAGDAEIEFRGELCEKDSLSADNVVFAMKSTGGLIVIAAIPTASFGDDEVGVKGEQLRVIDLENMSLKEAQHTAVRHIQRMDADRIGTFSGIGGLVEVGLGSILHAYKIPLKGHFLSSLQNLLLISFGKALNGRGLLRISFVSAMLKAFSPMGGAIRPMIFIFLQGAAFALPVHLLGWNAFTGLVGSVLMGALTLGISFGMNFLLFGSSIFNAVEKGVGQALLLLDIAQPSLTQLLVFAFSLRAAVSVIVFAVAYFGNPLPHISRLAHAAFPQGKRDASESDESSKNPKRASAALAALRGLFRPKFLVAFLISVLMMRFFTDLTSTELITVAVRGLCISYLGFLLMQRIDAQALGARLDKRFGLDLEKSLPIAAKLIGRPHRRD